MVTVTGLLTVIMVALLSLGLVSAREFPTAFDEQAKSLDAEDIQFFSTAPGVTELIADQLKDDDRVTRTEKTPTLAEPGSITYAGSDLNLALLYVDASESSELGRSRLSPETSTIKDGAYLPIMYQSGGGYGVGDLVEIRLVGGRSRTFTVAGFYENTLWSLVGSGVVGIPLTHAAYQDLAGQDDAPTSTLLVRADVADDDQIDSVSYDATQAATQEYLKQRGFQPFIGSTSLDAVRWGVLSTGMIYAVLLQSIGWVIAVVVMLVIAALVRNGISRDLPAIGIQKAVGMTSWTIMGSIVAPPLLSALLGVALGTGLGYVAMPWLASQLASISGLTWVPTFDLGTLGISAAIALGGVMLAAVLSSWRVLRIRPVSALGSGTTTHTFSWSPVKLRNARFPLNALLGIQQWLHSRGQAVAVSLVVAAVSFAAVFSTVLGAGVLGDKDVLQSILVGELADVTGSLSDTADADAARRAVEELPEVERAVYNDWVSTRVNGKGVTTMVTDDFSQLGSVQLWRGREPESDNEIALSAMAAADLGVGIGDQVDVQVGDATATYLVTGLVSTVQNSGVRADLTTSGYHRIAPGAQLRLLSIFLVDRSDANAQALTDQLDRGFGEYFSRVSNTRGETDSVLDSYVNLCRLLGIVILVVTGAVIALVLTVLVSTMIAGNEKSYGVRKALGFTTGNLITQTLWAYLPSVLVGAALGFGIGVLATRPVMASFLSSMGIMQIDAPLDVVQMMLVTLGLVVLSAALVGLNALRLRKLSAYKLITA